MKRCAHGWLNHADCEVCTLLAERDNLREQVNNALLALESISQRSYGDGDYLSLLIIIKKYATVKAADLREAIAVTEQKEMPDAKEGK